MFCNSARTMFLSCSSFMYWHFLTSVVLLQVLLHIVSDITISIGRYIGLINDYIRITHLLPSLPNTYRTILSQCKGTFCSLCTYPMMIMTMITTTTTTMMTIMMMMTATMLTMITKMMIEDDDLLCYRIWIL